MGRPGRIRSSWPSTGQRPMALSDSSSPSRLASNASLGVCGKHFHGAFFRHPLSAALPRAATRSARSGWQEVGQLAYMDLDLPRCAGALCVAHGESSRRVPVSVGAYAVGDPRKRPAGSSVGSPAGTLVRSIAHERGRAREEIAAFRRGPIRVPDLRAAVARLVGAQYSGSANVRSESDG